MPRTTKAKAVTGEISISRPRYLLPREYDDHYAHADAIAPFLCGCYHCHPEFWCTVCLGKRESGIAGTLPQDRAGLWANLQPDSIALKGGVPISRICKWHRTEAAEDSQPRPLPIQQILAKQLSKVSELDIKKQVALLAAEHKPGQH